MKKNLSIPSIAAISALALTFAVVSCTKQTPGQKLGEDESCLLTFAATTENTTRASIAETEVLPDNFSIHSTAWFIPNDGSNPFTYFYDSPFNNISGFWQSDAYKYWPVGGRLEFLCIAVDDEIMPLSEYDAFKWNDNKSTASVTVDVPNTQKMQSEVLYSAAAPSSKTTEVGLEFKHTQTLLKFEFETVDDQLVRLDSLTLNEVYMLGKLKVTNTSGVAPTAKWNFNYSYPVTAYVPGVKGKVLTTSSTVEAMLLIPAQTATSMNISYTKRNTTDDEWSKGTPYTATISNLKSPWGMGERHAYSISFGHSDVKVTIDGGDVTVTEYAGDWSEALDFEN